MERKSKWMIFAAMLTVGYLFAEQEFRFVVIGDTRPGFESDDFRQFQMNIGRINGVNPGFVVNLGDLIYGYGLRNKQKQWTIYSRVVKGIKAPYFQIPGNHDVFSRAAEADYLRLFHRMYYSFDWQESHFILLHDMEDGERGNIGPGQLAWLKNDLKNCRARLIFVGLHIPLWETRRVSPKYHELWRQTLHPLFKQYHVKAVFGCHFHRYGPTREFDGIRYFITGGGGAELLPAYVEHGGNYHFMVADVKGTDVRYQVVTPRATLSDEQADVLKNVNFTETEAETERWKHVIY